MQYYTTFKIKGKQIKRFFKKANLKVYWSVQVSKKSDVVQLATFLVVHFKTGTGESGATVFPLLLKAKNLAEVEPKQTMQVYPSMLLPLTGTHLPTNPLSQAAAALLRISAYH